ncbi:MAG: FAD-dependent oxidoreductase [Candidatus Omnitrophica bacterium]|nr:FAD-dependent oxidoreductase [Candidatus Omnitrophota bacterium]
MKNIVVLGAGLTGLTVARELSRAQGYSVVILEKESYVGGLAATLTKDGISFDLGSHRIHPDTDVGVLRYLRSDLGIELLKRPRRGALYLQGKFLRYPVIILDFIRAISIRKSLIYGLSYLANLIRLQKWPVDSYKQAMCAFVGQRIYTDLYEDFAWKLWGMDPAGISAEGMRRRSLAFNWKAIRKSVLGMDRYFFYPRHGIGEIAKRFEQEIVQSQGRILKGCRVTQVNFDKDSQVSSVVYEDPQGKSNQIEASQVISTIPVDALQECLFGPQDASESLKWRGLRVLYVHLKQVPSLGNDTFYFPERKVRLGRVSLIQKFSPDLNPSLEGVLLTIEFPCSLGDPTWLKRDDELLQIALEDLLVTGIYKDTPEVIRSFSICLEKAYPLYDLNWKERFDCLYSRINAVRGIYSVGRRGMFLHCNIDHSISQGLELASQLLGVDPSRIWGDRARQFREYSARD